MIGPEFFREADEAEAELRAEIERLRGALRETAISAEDAVTKREAEIKRLRGLVGLESGDLDLDWNRLRSGDRRALIADHQDVFDMVAAKQAEIERLRGDLDSMIEHNDNQKAEIERLRELVNACAIYLKEDETPAQRIERERADTEAVLKLLLKEKREAERLRELLRGALPDNENLDTDWHMRIRKALGE